MVSHFEPERPGAQALGRGGRRLVGYLRAGEYLTRGVAPWVITPVVFGAAGALADAVGGRAGVALVSGWVLFFGGYCVGNFWHCREVHCGITGPGWTVLGLLGLAMAAGAPGLSWLTVNVALIVFVVVLAVGYGVEWAVVASTGRHTLGRAGRGRVGHGRVGDG